MRKPFQCWLVDTVYLRVSICPNIFYHCLAMVVVQFVSSPFFAMVPRCPLQTSVGYRVLYVDLGQQSTTPSFPPRRIISNRGPMDPGPPYRWIQGPGPCCTHVPGAHKLSNHCICSPKDLGHGTWVPLGFGLLVWLLRALGSKHLEFLAVTWTAGWVSGSEFANKYSYFF